MPEDTPTFLSPGSYVTQVGERDDGTPIYQARERSNKFESGQIVPNSYAKSVLGAINYRNRVFGLLDTSEKEIEDLRDANKEVPDELPTNYQDAQKIVSEFNNLTDELNKAQKRDNDERIEEIERDLKQLRGKLGS